VLRVWLVSFAESRLDRIQEETRTLTRRGRGGYPISHIKAFLSPVRECPGTMHSGLKNAARRLARFFAAREAGYDMKFRSPQTEDGYWEALDNVTSSTLVSNGKARRLEGGLRRGCPEPRSSLRLPSMAACLTDRGANCFETPRRARVSHFCSFFPIDTNSASESRPMALCCRLAERLTALSRVVPPQPCCAP
jgi:hypothetical protein